MPSIANWTVPLPGVGETVAVNVTVAPDGAGFTFEVSAVVVSAGGGGSTRWVKVAVLALKFALPEYVARIWWEPVERPAVEKVATPPASATALPAGVPSIANWTVPSAADGATVAVKVTVAPNGAGLRFDVSVVVVGVGTGTDPSRPLAA